MWFYLESNWCSNSWAGTQSSFFFFVGPSFDGLFYLIQFHTCFFISLSNRYIVFLNKLMCYFPWSLLPYIGQSCLPNAFRRASASKVNTKLFTYGPSVNCCRPPHKLSCINSMSPPAEGEAARINTRNRLQINCLFLWAHGHIFIN